MSIKKDDLMEMATLIGDLVGEHSEEIHTPRLRIGRLEITGDAKAAEKWIGAPRIPQFLSKRPSLTSTPK